MKHVVTVDPNCTGLEGIRHAEGGVDVGGVHGSGKTVGSSVTNLNDLLLSLELGDGADWTEDFLYIVRYDNLRVRVRIGNIPLA